MRYLSKNRGFVITEAALLALAAFFRFALLGYGTMALCLFAAAVVVALFKLLSIMKRRFYYTALALRTLLIFLLSVAVLMTAYAEYFIITASHGSAGEDAPYVIVLGAGVHGTEPSLSLTDRLEPALDYLEKHPDAKAVLSGGQGKGENVTEAACMAGWLEERGIGRNRLILEEKAESTEENVSLSLALIEADGGDRAGRVGIISSEYHLYRSVYIAKELGAEAFGIPGSTSLPVLRLNYFLREAAAVWALWLS